MLDKRFNRDIESKWRKFWEENNIYSFNEEDKERPIYSIDTPPPFTSGELHMGHVLSYSYFDFAARYKRMKGFNVFYPQGWDTQGFPTEVKVEKKYGRLPPEEFRKKCVDWTKEFIAKMKEQMKEMAFSPDWRFEYRTMDPDYHRKVQLSLIKMYKENLIYRAKYPVFWCPKCRSAIAKAELEDLERTSTLNYITFKSEDGEELQIATTRPELMPACVAVLYHPDDERYKHLKGKKVITALGKKVPAIADQDVEKDFGTGLLMVCTFGDKMDVVWVNRYKLPVIQIINEKGRMINTGEFDGLKVVEARKKIIEKLEKEGKLVKKENIQQVVKIHDRCKSPVELLPSMQWFASIRNKAEEIRKWAHDIKWYPDFGIHYLLNWINNAEWDWVISRQRIFGTPLPFYYCEKCGYTEPVDENNLPFYPEHSEEKRCPKCGGSLVPERSVCDCWVDSSITPLIIAGWPEGKNFNRLYPATLRPQGVEIVRTWAFYTIYRCGVLTGKPPFKEILLNGNVLAPDGKKMSKSLGNIISPAQLQKEYPVDAIRQWAAMSGAMAKDRPFSYEDIKYAKNFLTKLWNAARFIERVTEDYDNKKYSFSELKEIDKWILSRLNKVISESTDAMEKYEFHILISKVQNFFWKEFCDYYLEYVKHRVYNPEEHPEERKKAQFVLRHVLYNTIKLLAPISPYITEEIYHILFKAPEEKSIHLSKWPEGGKVDENAVILLASFNRLVSLIRQWKAKNRLPQNAELESVNFTINIDLPDHLIDELKNILKIKNVVYEKGDSIELLEVKVTQ